MVEKIKRKVRTVLMDPDLLLIYTLFLPIFVDMILNNIISTVHTYLVSDLGDSVISGVGLSGQMSSLFVNIFTGMCSAVAVVVSQYNGAKNFDGARKCISQTLLTVTAFSCVVGAILFLFTEPIFNALFSGTEEEVLLPALKYLKYYAVSVPFYGTFQTFANASRGMGDNKIPLKISVSASVLNIIVAFITIKILKIGVAGAGLGLVISRFYEALMGYIAFARKGWLANVKDTLKLNFKIIGSVLALGMTMSSESIIVSIGATVKMNFLVDFGKSHLAARSIDATFSGLLLVPVTVFGVVAVTLVGRYIGANEPEEAKRILKKIIKCAYALYGALMILGMALLPIIYHAYTDSPETYSLLIKLMFVNLIMATPMWPSLNVTINGFKAAGDAKFTMIVSLACMWCINVGVGYLLTSVLGLGIVGYTISTYLSGWGKLILIKLRYRSDKWIHKRMVE